MPQETAAVANSVGFWIVCAPMVIVTLLQSIIFMRKAWKAGRKMGMPAEQIKRGMRSGAITAIAPSFAVMIALVGLISMVGSALAWLRLSVIGAIMFEGLAVSEALSAMGTAVGDPGYTLPAFANVIWVMAIGSSGWLLFTGLFTHKLDGIRNKAVGGRTYLLPIISVCAVLGAFGYQAAKQAVTFSRSTIAVLVSAAVMVAITLAADKTGKRWIKDWSLGIAMICGMFAAVIGLSV